MNRIRFLCLEILISSTSEPDLAEVSRFDGLYRAVIALQAAPSRAASLASVGEGAEEEGEAS